jgi:hypothetical protein
MRNEQIKQLTTAVEDALRGGLDCAKPLTDASKEGLRACAERCACDAVGWVLGDATPGGTAGEDAVDAGTSLSPARAIEPDASALRPGEIPSAPLPAAPPGLIELCVEISANARAGEPYRAALTVETRDGRPVRVDEVHVPGESGVHYDAGDLVGEHPEPGEYRITLTAMIEGPPACAGLAGEALLIVNPNPRDLWRNTPSDRDAPGWKPDNAHAVMSGAGGRTLMAASMRGRSHAHVGGFRDDDFAFAVTTCGQWNVLAVADGAGSANRSRIGSRVAAETAVAVAAGTLEAGEGEVLAALAGEAGATEEALRNAAYRVIAPAVFEAVKAIEAKARDHGAGARDYATTLLLVAHCRLDEQELIAAYQVGDGAMAALPTNAHAVLLGLPEGGEFSGQTRFLERDVVRAGDEIAKRIQVHRVGSLEALLMMTDGVSDPKFPFEAELANPARWTALWREVRDGLDGTNDPGRLCEWLAFHVPGHHDDRTLLVLR